MNKVLVIVICLLLLPLNACQTASLRALAGPDVTQYPSAPAMVDDTTTTGHALSLTIFAAASLTDAFEEIGQEFESDHPGVVVKFSFAGSQVLRTQLQQGAEADLVAFADPQNMDLLVSDDLVLPGSSRTFATNRLAVILPQANPGEIHSLADLAIPGKRVILADSSVPAGKYARQVLSQLSLDPLNGVDFSSLVMANVVSNETDVRQVVTKVELGEADAGFVYASDVVAAPGLVTIPIPDRYNVTACYPIAILKDAAQPDLAKEFIAYIVSRAGQMQLSEWGFSPVK